MKKGVWLDVVGEVVVVGGSDDPPVVLRRDVLAGSKELRVTLDPNPKARCLFESTLLE